jgi:GNAT superfamily N-acetyltransferase
MDVPLRDAVLADAPDCGRICHDAFAALAIRHGFVPDFPSVEVAVGAVSGLIEHPGFFSMVAERDGRIVGSNFLDERSTIVGVGPITVDPEVQGSGIGRALMDAVLERSRERRVPGVRLLQSAYNNGSMSLYAKLGFDVREPFAVIQGGPLGLGISGCTVRPASNADAEACNAVCARVHGHDRAGELLDALARGTASVVERNGRITGYTTGVGFFGHSAGETDDDVEALIGAAERFDGPGFLIPMCNTELLRWCLGRGLRVSSMMNLMTIGLYQEPRGPFLASVAY